MSEVTAVVKNGRGRPRKYEYPSKLKCTVTGRIVKTNPTQMKKQLEKSGKDLATFIATYVCRSARKLQETEGTPVASAPATQDSEGE